MERQRPGRLARASSSSPVEAAGISIESREGILNSLPMFIYILTKDYTFSYVNGFFRKEFGVPDQYTRCHSILRKCNEPCDPCPAMDVFSDGMERIWVWHDSLRGNVYEIHDIPFWTYDQTPRVLGVGFAVTEDQATRRDRLQGSASEKFLHLCCHCKKIRNRKGSWENMESYFTREQKLQFSHCICPDCMYQHYSDLMGDER